jgi:peptide chain release factor subunit 1
MTHERTLEKKDIEKFFQSLGENPEKTFLGEENTRRALQAGAVDVLYLSSKTPKPLTKEFTKIAEQMSSEIKIISTETPEGEQFYNMGGVGAILRYKI